MLQVYLLSSFTYLTHHILNKPVLAQQPMVNSQTLSSMEEEREKLKNALILTQDSAAIEILLETAFQDNLTVIRKNSIYLFNSYLF